jgi:acyl carrier protein
MDMASHSATTASRETAFLELALELSRELHPARRRRRLTPDSTLERDAGLDSLARVELLLRAEKRLGVRLPDHAILSAETFRDLLAAVEAAPAGEPVTASEGPAPDSGTSAEEEWPESAETLVEALEWHAQRHPNRPHIQYLAEGETPEAITYGELWTGARRIAAGLRTLDLEPGRPVAIMLPSGRPYFEAFMGTLMASGVAVPLYPPTRIHRLEEHVRRQARIMANAQASLLVTFEEVKKIGGLLKSLLPELGAIVTPAELAREPGGERLQARARDLAFLQYTSGKHRRSEGGHAYPREPPRKHPRDDPRLRGDARRDIRELAPPLPRHGTNRRMARGHVRRRAIGAHVARHFHGSPGTLAPRHFRVEGHAVGCPEFRL